MEIYKKYLSERKVVTKWDNDYQRLLKEAQKLPWDSRPQKTKTSALYGLEGKINGTEVSFSWHQPDTDWGPNWNFLGLTITTDNSNNRYDTKFNKTQEAVRKGHKSGQITDDVVKQNIKEFQNAIDYCKKL